MARVVRKDDKWDIAYSDGPTLETIKVTVKHVPSGVTRSRVSPGTSKAVKESEIELKQYITDLLEDI